MDGNKKILVINANAEIKSLFFYMVPQEYLIFKSSLEDAPMLNTSPEDIVGVFMRPYSKKSINQLSNLKSPHIHTTILGDTLIDMEKFNHLDVLDPYSEKIRLKATLQSLIPEQRGKEKEKTKLLGVSESIEHVRKLVHKVACLDSTVLITGETGTGKEVVAGLIHEKSHAQKNKFIPVHSAGIPETLLESTLFGHEKGAFTGAYKMQKGYFENANNGTIFLDEIGETSMAMQVKLLRVLQEHTFTRVGDIDPIETNARVIAATNKDLKNLVEQRKFREDLYYRLNVIAINLPPLRDRVEDIPILAMHFLRKFSLKHNRPGIYLKNETMEILKNHDWPGNVRELENLLDRLVALSDSDWISPQDLPIEFRQERTMSHCFYSAHAPMSTYNEAKAAFEKEYVIRILQKAGGNISEAARIAEMPRQNLHVKIKKYNLNAKKLQVDTSIFAPEVLN